jgi:hypothetical protein
MYRFSHFFAFLGSGAGIMTGIGFEGFSQKMLEDNVSRSGFVLLVQRICT